MLISNGKTVSYKCPAKSFKCYLRDVAGSDIRFNILHHYILQYPWVIGGSREFNSIFNELTRTFHSLYPSSIKYNRPAICHKGLEQAMVAYMEYRLYYGVN